MPSRLVFRLVMFTLGAGIVGYLLNHIGISVILGLLSRSMYLFPLVLLLEAGVLICSMVGLWHFYKPLEQESGRKIPFSEWVRAALTGYTASGIFPAGRTAGETARAVTLSKHVSGAKTALIAIKMQSVALFANAIISVPIFVVFLWTQGPTVATGLVLGNLLITAAMGWLILTAFKRTPLGIWIARYLPVFKNFGEELSREIQNDHRIPSPALKWEFAGRVLQVLQNSVLVVAVGGKAGLIPGLCSLGIHLVGAAVGDLIPAQIGVIELNYHFFGNALNLTPSDALAIPILAHLAQLFWVIIGLFVFAQSELRPAAQQP